MIEYRRENNMHCRRRCKESYLRRGPLNDSRLAGQYAGSQAVERVRYTVRAGEKMLTSSGGGGSKKSKDKFRGSLAKDVELGRSRQVVQLYVEGKVSPDSGGRDGEAAVLQGLPATEKGGT